ncbi:hypothetical protein [Hafnia alvei]|uniref:hypothetical protein n=1 Tax=Hafnia alvei TaxID=569 RepID=UPI0011EC42C0|nr:hypothetical protein [Hafnia alvei]KAA0261781.1 hypothetical protein ERL64_13970 [Hafnia alvei]
MLTVTLGNQTTTLTRRDALQLSEGILLSLRNPYNLGEGGAKFGALILEGEKSGASTSNNTFSAFDTEVVTNC